MAAGDTLTRAHVDKGELRGPEGRRAMREYRLWSIEYGGSAALQVAGGSPGWQVAGFNEAIRTGGEAGVAWVGRGSPSPPLGSKDGRLGEPSQPRGSHPSPCQLASLPAGQLMKVNPGGGEGIRTPGTLRFI